MMSQLSSSSTMDEVSFSTDAIEMDSPEVSQQDQTTRNDNSQTPSAYTSYNQATTRENSVAPTANADDTAASADEPHRGQLPFGAIAARQTAASSSSSSTSSASASSSSSLPLPSPSVAIQSAHVGRTPPPLYPEYQKWGEKKAVGFKGKTFWFGLQIFNGMEFVGEVFADFLGLYDSKYQYVIDAYERNKREVAFEKAERQALRREAKEEAERLERESDPMHQRVEENRRTQNIKAAQKQQTDSNAASSSSSSSSAAVAAPSSTAVSSSSSSSIPAASSNDPQANPDARMPDV